MTFGRQKNVSRRPVRPDAGLVRDLRRGHGRGKASLLELPTGPRPPSLAARMAAAVGRLFGRR